METKITAVRIPQPLLTRLIADAEKHNRTLSGEIIDRLTQSFRRAK